MRLERSKNTKRNIIAGEADRLSGILLPFIVRTMIIHQMGASYLGLTGLFYSIIQMLNLAEMGFGMAITFSMYKPIADNDAKTINALLKFYARIYRVVGAIIGAAGLLMLVFLPYMIEGEIPQDINIYLLYLIYLADACINCFLYPERKALLTAYQRNDVTSNVHILTQAGMYIMQMIFIALSRNFYLYALTVPVSTICFSLGCAYRSKKIFGQYRCEGELDPESSREIKKQVIGLMVRKVASMSRNAFDSIFVSAFLGLSITAIYGNYYYVMDAVVMLLAVVKNSMAGGVGNSIAMEPVKKNLRDMHTINFLFMWISGWCAICMLCLYQPFMRLWVGDDMTLPNTYAILFAAYFYILKMADIRILYSESVGLWWQARYLSVVEAAANLVLNWLFTRLWGLAGIVFATMLSYAVFNFVGGARILYKHYFSNENILPYFGMHLKYFAVTAGIGAVTYAIVRLLPLSGVPELLVTGVLCVIIPGALYFLVYRNTEDFKNAEPFLGNILHRNQRKQ